MTTRLKAPAHLKPATREWWEGIVTDYVLESHHLKILTLAAEALDRCEEARKILGKEGIVIVGREGGSRPHPCIAIERDSRIAFARLIAQLSLDAETIPDAHTRDALRSTRAGGWRGH
jgi:phage terminase small subunit